MKGALIVGGGIAGMECALNLANSGIRVYLVEKGPSIGGKMALLDKTFPTNDCSMCIMAPRLVEIGRHPNIEILTLSEVIEVNGDAGNFRVRVRKRPRYVSLDRCIRCGLCAEKCPIKLPDETNLGMSIRKAIYMPFPQAVPSAYLIDDTKCLYLTKGKCGLCKKTCPAEAIDYEDKEEIIDLDVGSIVLAPGYDVADATARSEFMYGKYRNVLTSLEFERMLSASGPTSGSVIRPSDGGHPKKIAFISCVSSRDRKLGNIYCSSICCMYLIKEAIIAKEHDSNIEPTIFFIDVRAFGKDFERYYEQAIASGVRCIYCRVSSIIEKENGDLIINYRDENGKLQSETFNMAILAVAVKPHRDIKKLAETFGIELDDYDFIKTSPLSPLETNRSGIYVAGMCMEPMDIPDSVAQSTGAAAKVGAIMASERWKYVEKIVYPEERDISSEEPRVGVFVCRCGINISNVVDVPSVVEYAKKLDNVVCAEESMYVCSRDAQRVIKDCIKKYNLNRVVVAACTPRTHESIFKNTLKDSGLNPYLFEMVSIREHCSWIHMNDRDEATKKAKSLVAIGVAKASQNEMLATGRIKVIPSALVIGGGAAGMNAALDISSQGYRVHLIERDMELGGNLRRLREIPSGEDVQQYLKEIKEKIMKDKNIEIYTSTEIKKIEGYIGNYKTSIIHEGDEKVLEHGVVIVATGGEEYKPDEYMYGEDERVMTHLEFEDRLYSNRIEGNNFVFIQCVGSRDDKRPYCSRVCCAHTMHSVIKLKEKKPEANIFVFYRDIRTYGKNEEYYQRAREKGVLFIRYDKERKPEVYKENDVLKVKAYDSLLDTTFMIDADAIILATAIVPKEDNDRISQMLKVSMTSDRFFMEAHMKLRPVDFAADGVFLCGLAHAPKSLSETISQASACAARAVLILSAGHYETEGIIASVNEELCDGCGICEPICEFKAIEIVSNPKDSAKKIAKVNEALCKGCGACVAACPSGAMEQMGFKSNQLLAMIKTALTHWEGE